MKNIRLVVDNDRKAKQPYFIKNELQTILNLYAKMVSNGTWKDYSLYTGNKEISFNIYKRASEKPILRILKNLKPNYKNEKYLIKDKNGKVIQKSENLKLLIESISIQEEYIYFCKSLLGLDDLNQLTKIDRDDLKENLLIGKTHPELKNLNSISYITLMPR